MISTKILFVLHVSPPLHGAARVGDLICSSKNLKDVYDTRFVKIRGSESVSEVGRFRLNKLTLGLVTFFEVLWVLIVYRPDKIYFTPSIRGLALYRDVAVSLLWKCYRFFFSVDIYYHYHAKGVSDVVSCSMLHVKIMRFFLSDVNLVLLSEFLERDFDGVRTYKRCLFLPNGIPDQLSDVDFEKVIAGKYNHSTQRQALYLSQMTEMKGYREVLDLARQSKGQGIHFNFAGAWDDDKDRRYFYNFVETHKLQPDVTYHGFVSGQRKQALFNMAHFLLYPSKDDAFPLTILESLSSGIPVIATAQGAIPGMLDDSTGMIMYELDDFSAFLREFQLTFVNQSAARSCRVRYQKNFSFEVFEENLVQIFKN